MVVGGVVLLFHDGGVGVVVMVCFSFVLVVVHYTRVVCHTMVWW